MEGRFEVHSYGDGIRAYNVTVVGLSVVNTINERADVALTC